MFSEVLSFYITYDFRSDELTRDDNKSLPSAPKLSSARPSESELTAAMGLDFGDESFPTSTPEPLKPVIATAPVRPKAPSPNITTISSQSLASPATQPKADPKSVPTPKTMEKTVLAAKNRTEEIPNDLPSLQREIKVLTKLCLEARYFIRVMRCANIDRMYMYHITGLQATKRRY